MKKTFLALCIALLVFMCSSLPASAVVCHGAPDGVHHFTAHALTGKVTTRDGGPHSYLYGYDHNGKAIYKDNCRVTIYEYYCRYKCEYCVVWEGSNTHMHNVGRHSVNHN